MTEDLKKLVDERVAKALKERLAPIAAEVKEMKDYVRNFPKEFKRVNERLDADAKLYQDLSQRFDDVEAAAMKHSIALAISDGFSQSVIEIIKSQSISQKPPKSRESEPSKNEPMSVSVDLNKITWMQKDRKVVSASAQWGWAFAFDRDGRVLPETREIVELLNRYGEIEVDGHIVKFGGDRGNLLNKNRRKKK